MHYGLMHWYAAARAAGQNRDEITLEDVQESLRQVELYYAMHSKFHAMFREFPMLRTLMDRLFTRPIFPISMVRGEWTQA